MRAAIPTCLLLATAISPFFACNSPRGDEPADAGAPSALGSGSRIKELTAPLNGDKTDGIPPNPTHPAQNETVYITGASVVTVDNFDETQDGKSIGDIYIEDVGAWTGTPAQGAFSGIQLYKNTFSPASLHVAPGDVIDLTGPYTDYAGPSTAPFTVGTQPEMDEPISTFRFEYTAPVPLVVDVTDLNVTNQASFDLGDRWMSMLVTVKNVTLTAPMSNDGKGRVVGPITSDVNNGCEIDNELYNLQATDYAQGTVFASITGVVTFFFNFHISPRSAADVVVQSAPGADSGT